MVPKYDPDLIPWQAIVAVWLLVVGFFSIRRLAQGDQRTMWFVQLVHVGFCGGPLWLDLIVGPPQYSYQVGFAQSQFDPATNAAYLALAALVPVVLWWSGSRGAVSSTDFGEAPWRLGWIVRVVAWMCVISPIVAIVLAPEPALYLQPAAILGPMTTESRAHHVVVTLLLNFSVLAAAFLLAAPDRTLLRVAVLPWIAAALWVAGKRGLVATTAAILLFFLWQRGVLRGMRLATASAALAGGILLFSAAYERAFRVRVMGDIEQGGSYTASTVYVNFRTDFGRDAVVKQAIFAELHPDVPPILDYRGQSLLFSLAFFVPRAVWPGKPMPYASYATATMLGVSAKDFGWGVTTSWLDEAIANFGWLGLLLGPLVPGLVCAVGDRQQHPIPRALTVVVASLLLTVNLAAFLALALAWGGSLCVFRQRVTGA